MTYIVSENKLTEGGTYLKQTKYVKSLINTLIILYILVIHNYEANTSALN